MTRVIRSVSVSLEFDNLTRIHKISLTEACKIGTSILLREKGLKEYDNRINILREIDAARAKISSMADVITELTQRYGEKEAEKHVL